MSGSCGKIVLFIIAAVAALNILLAAFGWNTIISKNSTTNDPTEKLHFALENLRHELRMVHNRQNQTPNVPQLVTEVSLAPKSVHLKVSNEKSDAEMNSSNPSKSVVIFTMDSISSYEKNSLSGGAAGELTVRRSLEHAFRHFGAKVDVLKSDEEFDRCDLNVYDIIILDPWTWAAKGWVPKKKLVGLDSKVYMLDFFGSKGGLRGPAPGLKQTGLLVPPSRFLTAFGSPDNTFLGYFMPNTSSSVAGIGATAKLPQGVIWGKDVRHLGGRETMLQAVAAEVRLVSTASSKVVAHPNIRWTGHQTAAGWLDLLRQSRFLVGLGNPILGPSAIDAVSQGCVFINPVYEKPVAVNGYNYHSQHPYAADRLGAPYVCSYRQGDAEQLLACVRTALATDLPVGTIPYDFTLEAHLARVQHIFDL